MAQTECFFNDIDESVTKIRDIASGLDYDWTEEMEEELRERASLMKSFLLQGHDRITDG